MKTSKKLLALLGLCTLFFSSCSDIMTENENLSDPNLANLQELKIPKGFDFSTDQTVQVTINDANKNVKYDVYAYSDKKTFKRVETYQNEEGKTVTDSIFSSPLDNLVFSGVTHNGVLKHSITIPKYYNSVHIIRNDNLKFSASSTKIINQAATFSAANSNKQTSKSKSSVIVDYLYGVNSFAQLFQIDPLTGVRTSISAMPTGSFACAIDQENQLLYAIGGSAPFPLMKYSIADNTWTIVGNTNINANRLEYNPQDGLLYLSFIDQIYTFNTTTGAKVSTKTITGLHSTQGGDLAFAADGTLYLCTFSGLYKLNASGSNSYTSTRISADNLPFNPTSMTFDSNNELWLANTTSATEANLIVMDTNTGGWQYKYGVRAPNNTTINEPIHDLSTFKVFTSVQARDTDGDGVSDMNDEYPNDGNKAFNSYTPSRYGWGTVAFEDLWPFTGDYDFNDLAVNYRATTVLNAQNLAVQINLDIKVKNIGGSFINGFGMELSSLTPSQIASVTGCVLSENIVTLNANGTESGQQNAVVILFDNSRKMSNTSFTVTIKLNTPITTDALGTAPFNVFMIRNKERSFEVHLPNQPSTTLGRSIVEVQGVNRDKDGNFLTDGGLPWAINIVHDFKLPKEKIPVNQAYLKFNQWASSGGTSFEDWYKDSTGYRDATKINN